MPWSYVISTSYANIICFSFRTHHNSFKFPSQQFENKISFVLFALSTYIIFPHVIQMILRNLSFQYITRSLHSFKYSFGSHHIYSSTFITFYSTSISCVSFATWIDCERHQHVLHSPNFHNISLLLM